MYCFTQSILTLRLSVGGRMHARTHGWTENIYSIFRVKLLLLGEHGLQYFRIGKHRIAILQNWQTQNCNTAIPIICNSSKVQLICHFQFTSLDSILDIPPRRRKLYNHLLFTLSLKYYLFFTFLVLFVKSEKCIPTNLSAINESKFSVQHLFFQFSLPHNIVYLLFVYPETYFTFCLSVAANFDITILLILAAMQCNVHITWPVVPPQDRDQLLGSLISKRSKSCRIDIR